MALQLMNTIFFLFLFFKVSELESSYIKNEEETVVRSLKRATIEEENR